MKNIAILLFVIIGFTSCNQSNSEEKQANLNQSELSAEEAKEIAKEAYIYGFAIVENYKAIFGMCIYEKSPAYAGFNNYLHGKKLFDPDYKTVVSANNDTYYSTTFADLSQEPLVIKVPPTNETYFVIQLVDMFTDNTSFIGTRATGKKGGTFLLVGPDNKISVPTKGFDRIITARGRYVALATRTATDGSEEGNKKAFAIQDGLELMPLSKYLGIDAPTSPTYKPNFPMYNSELLYSKPELFVYLNNFLEWQSPSINEIDLMAQFSKLHIGPYREFKMENFNPEIQKAIQEGIDEGHQTIVDRANSLGENHKGWEYTPPMGNYGENYLLRSAVAYKFIYTNSPEEALYPIAEQDADGNPLDGSKNEYVLHFNANELPPVEAFWSMTMYHSDSRLMVKNEINRYSIGDRTQGLKYNEDGSLTLYIQKDKPSIDKENNWLPAPNGDFYIIARLYIPKEEAASGVYKLPAIQK
ncbi:MAG: DUF1214 domain-containing protein [Bacteroidota bacterium]|nr:DUF1214 domain-containing protein [Bacteroidota bacterium]